MQPRIGGGIGLKSLWISPCLLNWKPKQSRMLLPPQDPINLPGQTTLKVFFILRVLMILLLAVIISFLRESGYGNCKLFPKSNSLFGNASIIVLE